MNTHPLPLIAENPASQKRDTKLSNGIRVFIETYGCQMNLADSELLRGILAREGFETAEDPAGADIILLNTCAVRENAEDRVLGRLGELTQFKHANPRVIMGVTGCMAEHLRDEIPKRAKAVDFVVGPDSYRRLPEILATYFDAPVLDIRLDRGENYVGLDPTRSDGVTAWVPIMRGCDRFCTFCIVPYTRGREKSLPPEEILRQVRLASEQGFREVCLLGQTVNSYRYESVDFSDLLRMVGGVEGVERIRFMSPHPVGFSPALIAAIAEVPQISPHMHLPVQSGSNSVLARMRRDYTIEEYLAVLTKLRAAVPGIAVSTDVIVGFCGETEEDYRKTFDLMEASRFDFAFMFVYSPRVGTVAARSLEDDVPEETKKRRIAEIVALQERISAEIFAGFIGRTVKVLFEGPSKKRKTQSFGRTPDFKSVVVDGEYAKGIFADVAVTEANAHTLFGKVVS